MSTVGTAGQVRRHGSELTAGMRALLGLFGVLTLLALIDLYGRPDATAELFAWTIQPPLTAAFLGAGYGAGCLLVLMSLRNGVWAAVRVPLLTILVFTAVSLAATLLHLDRFHLSGDPSIAVGAGWFWLVVYVVIPPLMLVFWLLQERHTPGAGPARMPRGLAAALELEGAVMSGLGVVLFAAPATAATLWPWTLTPLTARAVAAWLIAFGLATLYAGAREGLSSGRVQALAYTSFGTLQLLALARFPETPRWDLSGWLYLAFLVAVTMTGAAGLLLELRGRRAADGPAPARRPQA